jgi:hypothetical protein
LLRDSKLFHDGVPPFSTSTCRPWSFSERIDCRRAGQVKASAVGPVPYVLEPPMQAM